MNRRLRTRTRRGGFICLIGLLGSLLLAGVVQVVRQRVLFQATTASLTPLTGEAEWEGNWAFSELGADPSEAGSQDGTDRVAIPFSGTDLALQVRRGDYRAYLYVSVDGKPANLLPRDERGAYLVLTSPDRAPQVNTIPVAGGLEDDSHIATVVAERGWTQWPLAGWRVSRTPDTSVYRWALAGLGVLGIVSLVGLIWWGVTELRKRKDSKTAEPGDAWLVDPQLAIGGSSLATPILGSPITVLLASAAFYFLDPTVLTLASGLALAGLILWRLDLGLALVAATAPFFLQPREFLGKEFSMAEIAALLCLLSWGVRQIPNLRLLITEPRSLIPDLLRNSLDLAALFFILVVSASFFVADHRHVALRELRVLILEPALFYLMLRTTRLSDKAIWRTVDFFVLGAIAVALIGLVQYALGVNVITAEGGFRRLRSVYGSPNSVGLYVGRVLPLAVAVALFGRDRARRIAYGLAAVPLGLAVLLSFSKGALLLGVPLSLLALGMLAGGRWLWASLAAIVAAAVASIPLLRTPRFASLFDTQSGTLFFRLHLWRSSWTMFREHPWLGVGPDNFLYHYRSRYILPAAWQEPDLSQAHDILLDYATRAGVPGLLAGTWLQVAFWRLALPLRRLADPDHRALALGLMASMVNFLAHGLVDASYFLIDLAFAFFLTLGVVQWLSRSNPDGNQG
jgi:O-antigen ligase